jgi:lipopolysaccharide export system ATP-binding protein
MTRTETPQPEANDSSAAPASTGSGIEARGLIKRYNRTPVVNGVDITVNRGEVVGLLGPNGAGKTTSFRMIVGNEHVDGGEITLGGRDITRLPMHVRARLGIGYLAQEPSIFRRLSVADNVMAILETLPITKDERRERLETALTELDVNHIRDRRGYQLSGGERRRVEIARALVTSPSFILLDEPFVGIDPIAVADIQDIVGRLQQRGLGVLITDHNVRETLNTTDRAYLMCDGKILIHGTAEQLANNPTAREMYLGRSFRL